MSSRILTALRSSSTNLTRHTTPILLAHSLRPALTRPNPPHLQSLHNLIPTSRPISFARVLPKLFSKFATLGAVGGGATIAGLAYVQNQASATADAVGAWVSGVTDGAKGVVNEVGGQAGETIDRMKRGWELTKSNIQTPEWLNQILEGGNGSNSSGNQGPGGEPPKESRAGVAAAGGAAGVALGSQYSDDDEDDDNDDNENHDDSRRSAEEKFAKDEQMMLLTKKMIHIRSLLQSIGQGQSLTLPSIVVIGSQSSGKSSVLEAIVGHEFLPKGHNMVTRRPIELTLVNTPNAKAEYAEFPALGLGKLTDFSSVQRTLTDLNLAVPAEKCVSDDPIQLRIFSPNVPDLSLIDLPGYIQVVGEDQPPELKQKISDLCEKYIQPPNVILAISAADVDLANSTALRASRRVDPRGERTIGVITKMDLVEPDRGLSLLTDKKYPLRLGYVGVVCKIPSGATGKFFSRGKENISGAIAKNERAYFTSHAEFGQDVSTGTPNLKTKLMRVLEQTMSASLKTTGEKIRQELAEASYEFKVQYNDRPLSAETYLAESLDSFKHAFRGFADNFGRDQVRELVKHELDQQVMNILAQKYWNRPFDDLSVPLAETDSLSDLPKAEADHPLWQLKLDTSQASLTKLGIGRVATNVLANSLQNHVEGLVLNSTFANHKLARKAITDAASTILKDLSFDVSDELEICVKPYKYRIALEDSEWKRGRDNISKALKQELKDCEAAIKIVENQVGGRYKLKEVMSFIDRVRSGQVVLEGNGLGGAGGFSAALLAKGREAVFLRDRSSILRMRTIAVNSKQCANKDNKYYCPEVFLDAVADKLTTTADLFLDAEMLSKFNYSFPRELDSRLGRSLSQADVERFAREDVKIQKHLDLVKRKDLLEHVLKEMDSLRQLDTRERERERGRDLRGGRSKGWGLF